MALSVRFQEFEIQPGKPARLKAEVVGELIDSLRHAFTRDPDSFRCAEAKVGGWNSRFFGEIVFS